MIRTSPSTELKNSIKNLPDSPGVYLFKKGHEILYIGKATSLRDRVRSYFSNDIIISRGALILQMVSEAETIAHEKTDSVLEALILEANLIKKYKPRYNTKEKDNKSFNYVVITKEEYPRVLLIRGREVEAAKKGDPSALAGIKIKYSFGPFPHGAALKEAIKIIRRIFSFRDKCVPFAELSLKKQEGARPCFNAQIGLCPGICSGDMTKEEYKKQVQHIKLFFDGKKSRLLSSLEKEMKAYAKKREFEKAEEMKRKIYALTHIQDIALIKRANEDMAGVASDFRIEAYDIAHISGSSTVGVMTVVEDGEPKKSDYRMFRIRGNFKGSDTAALREVLLRRFNHPEWQYPHLIVIDGGTAQLNAAKSVLELHPTDAVRNARVVSVVKDERHNAREVLGIDEILKPREKDIILANSESHRFALKYHRKVRGRF